MRLGKSWAQKVMTVFGFVMIALYLGLGIVMVFFPVFPYVTKEISVIFGVFLFLYGAFRLVRQWQKVTSE